LGSVEFVQVLPPTEPDAGSHADSGAGTGLDSDSGKIVIVLVHFLGTSIGSE
jgi:hypothetical protein